MVYLEKNADHAKYLRVQFFVGLLIPEEERRPRRRAYGAATSRSRLRRAAAAAALWSLHSDWNECSVFTKRLTSAFLLLPKLMSNPS